MCWIEYHISLALYKDRKHLEIEKKPKVTGSEQVVVACISQC